MELPLKYMVLNPNLQTDNYIFEMKFSFAFLFEFFHKNMNLFWWGCALLSNCGAFQPQKLLRYSRMLKKPICG